MNRLIRIIEDVSFTVVLIVMPFMLIMGSVIVGVGLYRMITGEL